MCANFLWNVYFFWKILLPSQFWTSLCVTGPYGYPSCYFIARSRLICAPSLMTAQEIHNRSETNFIGFFFKVQLPIPPIGSGFAIRTKKFLELFYIETLWCYLVLCASMVCLKTCENKSYDIKIVWLPSVCKNKKSWYSEFER